MDRAAVDIETLLTTAYRDNAVHCVSAAGILGAWGPASGGSPTAAVCAHLARGTAVDRSSAGAVSLGAASQMQAVSDDLIDLHEAVMMLPSYYIDLVTDDYYVVWDSSTLKDAHALGYTITGSGTRLRIASRSGVWQGRPRRGYRNGVPLVAPAPAEGACALYPVEREPAAPSRPLHHVDPTPLLIACARAGVRPDLSPPVVERWRPVYRGRRKECIGYEPVWITAPRARTLERATYAVWRDALTVLVDNLAGLQGYSLRPCAVPAEPWEGETEEHLKPCPGARVDRPPCNGEKAW